MNQELCWYNDYNLNLEVINQTRLKDYINKLSNKNDDNVIETKINQIEKDYQNKLIEIEGLCKNPNEILTLNVGIQININCNSR